IPAGVTSVDYYAWFNNDSIFVNLPQKDIKVTFKCNMEYEIGSGRFNPQDDSISVNGSFNGWSSKKDVLDPDFQNTNLYVKEVIINAVPTDKIEYKFWYEPGTWESVDNRIYEFTQDDYDRGEVELPEVYFNNGSLETMTAEPVAVKLTVNTKDAVAANGTKFTSVKTVHVAGSAKPLSWPGGGWPTTDAALMIPLYNDGTHGDADAGDDIFTTIITFPKYTVLNVEYKYSINFGSPDNSGVNDNEGSVGGNHILKLKPNMISCTVVDTFGLSLGKPSFLKDEVLLGVQVVDNVKPASYVLEQNYPNPFNPSTMIKFAVANSGFTTLKVYNMLGQEVATLVNDNLQAGTYTVDFNASNLNSGIYVYELRSGAVKIAKKMMLVK
ncbi:MAG TPA: T9SS type A sorting domain-containing protein, partial [Ignavibacteriales bacterium]|nr:T9SS type A sorting domain-containing protein [Ignavibacteriales bacterium]